MDPLRFSRHQSKYSELNYLAAFPFYTENDKWFRYLRDQYLLGAQYDELMAELMAQKNLM